MSEHVGVVVPARDESALISRCLTSIVTACAVVEARTSIIVVADGCHDDTAEIARRFDGVLVHELAASNVGVARAVGSQIALDLDCTWLAHTDADSLVPPNWVSEQLAHAAAGIDVVIGTVRPDFADLTASHRAHWLATHKRGEPNGHVHGANLGVRASVCAAIGGFAALPEHEDVDLVERLSRAGAVTVASDRAEVVTSGRMHGRTAGGYAGYLRAIARDLEESQPVLG